MRFAVFIGCYVVHTSPPLLNLLGLLAERAEVDVYVEGVKDAWPTVLLKKGVRFHRMNRDVPPIRETKHDVFITIDPLGIRLCQQLFPGAQMVHYSLELYVRGDIHCESGSVEHSLEFKHLIHALMIQSPERARVFIKEYELPQSIPLCILPITFEEPVEDSRSDYLRRRYGIRNDQSIALHFGETTGKYNVVNIARAFKGLSNWVAIFHGYGLPGYKLHFEQYLRKNHLDNVIISEEFCHDIRDTYRIIASADVGLAWYNNVTVNLGTAGRSSGKIAAYLRRGIPVIGNRSRSMIEALEETSCGIAVKHEGEIPSALSRIQQDYDHFRAAALKTYQDVHHFPTHADRVFQFLTAEGRG